jgi:Fe-S oxidoreductase
MATYKAEFTHHHYAGRPWARPRSHWSMGWLPAAARLASLQPRAANAVTGSRLAPLLKRVGGIAPERAIPGFATVPLRRRLRSMPRPSGPSRGRVVLWPDTFTAFLAPDAGVAAARVLAAAGFDPVLPSGSVCCGLTWVSTGQLGVARKVLHRSLRTLAPELAAGTPIVGLEPSCTAMLRHDAADLLGSDPLARQARSSVMTLAELLADRAPDWRPPQVGGEALVQVHCHQHAVMGFDADRALMEAAGVRVQVPDSGCCGLAGNFGFENGHYELSRAVGERVILPAVRAAPPTTAVVADGFSCRTQIEQGTTRRATHLAELLASGLE